ncbi:MAG: SPOR domain-containing protein [Treponema sp.]|jgi:hypothetical protein|nr:SPOR domain-containing protein [Treponema sp.]
MNHRFQAYHRFFIAAGLLLISGLCSAQQVRVIGSIPSPQSEKHYIIQVGAFGINGNAERAARTLRELGFAPQFERYGNLTRVYIAGIRASDVCSRIGSLGQAGFQAVIIREDRGFGGDVPNREPAAPQCPAAVPRDPAPFSPPAPRKPAAVPPPAPTAPPESQKEPVKTVPEAEKHSPAGTVQPERETGGDSESAEEAETKPEPEVEFKEFWDQGVPIPRQ